MNDRSVAGRSPEGETGCSRGSRGDEGGGLSAPSDITPPFSASTAAASLAVV